MIRIEKTDVFGWDAAIRGLRNPMNSWEKSDITWTDDPTETKKDWLDYDSESGYVKVLGPNDLSLMKKLVKAGSDHSKFMRMINVTCDITAPLYWWKEYDTYKVGTVANSCSTMHKIHAKELTIDDFSHEHLSHLSMCALRKTIDAVNTARDSFLLHNSKDDWWQMIQLLPTSYNQKRTVQLNYAVLRNMYFSRRNHKLDEWRNFCEWMETLPYAKELICDD